MAKKDKGKGKKDAKGKGKGKGKKDQKEVGKSEEFKVEDPKEAKSKADDSKGKGDSKGDGKKSTKGKNAGDKKGKGDKDKEGDKAPEQYVSPFSDNVDDHGFGFEDQATDLADLEHMLNVEVDEDFFVEPRHFHTLRRVIAVLGIHVADDAKEDLTGKQLLERNPAYMALHKQDRVVDQAIDHMSKTYCNALNRSVIQVGRIAREFEDAISKVESLRSQVRAIQETIGARSANGTANQSTNNKDDEGEVSQAKPSNQMSLRELWMLKLESEAMLSMIGMLNIVRDAPARFDELTDGTTGANNHTCRIGAATGCLTTALETMFSDEMSQIDALSQILENLMVRKAKAEEIVWETLEDILYLRTANGHVLKFEVRDEKQQQLERLQQRITESAEGGKNNTSKPATKQDDNAQENQEPEYSKRIYNPFQKNYLLLCVEDRGDNDDISIDSQGSATVEGDENADDTGNKRDSMHHRTVSEGSFGEESVDGDGNRKRRMMIPKEVVLSDLDLSAEELKCFDAETKSMSIVTIQPRPLPRYSDPVLSLRIIVKCLLRLGILPKAEEFLMKNVEEEIKKVFQREQARTFYRLYRRRPLTNTIRTSRKVEGEELKEFRRHFTALLSCFGCILMRYSHLAQIARTLIMEDEELSQTISNPKTFFEKVLDKAHSVMNTELKDFLRACLQSYRDKGKQADSAVTEDIVEKAKIFSFGVLEGESEEQKEEEAKEEEAKAEEEEGKKGKKKGKSAPEPEPEPEPPKEEEKEKDTTPKFSEMPATKFVSSVLFPMTNTTPQIQHALVFRRSIDRYSKINEARMKELAEASGATYVASRRSSEHEQLAIEFLDKAIKDNVIPYIQQEGLNGAIISVAQQDAFDPPAEANVYARSDKIQPLDVAMVLACEGVMEKTQPLFMAIHRLPPGGDMYNENVDVLSFCIGNFLKEVDAKVKDICEKTTSDELLEGLDEEGGLAPLFGKRPAFITLLKAYEFDLTLMDDEQLGIEASKSFDGEGGGAKSPEKGGKKKLSIDIEKINEGLERDEGLAKEEMEQLKDYLDFLPYHQESLDYDLITKGELKEAICLAHSLLKCTSLLEKRLKPKGSNKLLVNIGSLHNEIKKLKALGIKLAKFCHMEVVLQIIFKMSKVCNSTTLCAHDAVRVPTSVNGVAEWLASMMEYLREASSNSMAAYSYSNLGQYIPACLMSTVRVIAAGEGIILKAPLTMNGIESLDRSAAVLYKDLKASTGFQSMFFNIQLTAVNFERAATFTALMEMSREELAEYYSTHSQSEEFSDDDYELMFGMDGPRRRGDDKQFKKLKGVLKQRKKDKEEKKKAGQQAQQAQPAATT